MRVLFGAGMHAFAPTTCIIKAESFSEASFFKTLSSKVLEVSSLFLGFSAKKKCQILWSKGYYRPRWVYKHQKNENSTKTYEDKVLKNEASEKDSALHLVCFMSNAGFYCTLEAFRIWTLVA